MSIPAVSDSTIRPRDTDSKSGYRVTVRGALPADLTQRISALHALAIRNRLEAQVRQKAIHPSTPVDEQSFTQLRE